MKHETDKPLLYRVLTLVFTKKIYCDAASTPLKTIKLPINPYVK